MTSVVGRVNEVKQPRGGYVNPAMFTATQLDDGKALNPKENIPPYITGLAVDYLSRFVTGAPVAEAFAISILCARVAQSMGYFSALSNLSGYLSGICGLDDRSITSACKAVTFDSLYRNPYGTLSQQTAGVTNPDRATVENIRIMVERSRAFFAEYGPVTEDGFTFEPNGYSQVVTTGDGDFLTSDTLWDFKVSKYGPSTKHTLQLLMYWIMGQYSGNPIFHGITKIGIYNPRLNTVYTMDVSDIPEEAIRTVERDVICY